MNMQILIGFPDVAGVLYLDKAYQQGVVFTKSFPDVCIMLRGRTNLPKAVVYINTSNYIHNIYIYIYIYIYK